jgi:hypothetical protein
MKKPTVDLPIEICGRIALPEQYEFLSEIWAKNIDDRPMLIKFKIANNDGMLKRNQIGYYDAAETIKILNRIDIITPAYEIGYVKK